MPAPLASPAGPTVWRPGSPRGRVIRYETRIETDESGHRREVAVPVPVEDEATIIVRPKVLDPVDEADLEPVDEADGDDRDENTRRKRRNK